MHRLVSAGATGHPVGEFEAGYGFTARLSYPSPRWRWPKSEKTFEGRLGGCRLRWVKPGLE